MADPELIKDIRPYVEFILSVEPKQIKRKLIVKEYKEAISEEQGEDNDILMGFLLELTQKYPDYEYDETIDKLKSGELSIQEGVEEIGLLNSKEETPAKVSAEVSGEDPAEVPGEVPAKAQVTVAKAEAEAEAEAGNEDENDGFLAPPSFNDDEEEEEEEEENENSEASVTPDESEGIAKPAVIPLATEPEGRAAMVAQEGQHGCKKGLPVRAKSTLAQGDCFYSSIYRSAGEAGLLERIQECLGVEIDTEDNFVESMRGVVASKVLDGQLPSDNPGQDTFDILKEQVLGGLWHEVLKAYPGWFIKDYKKGLPKRERFLEKFAARVATRTLLVSQIEVTMVETALKSCGIKINKQNHDIARGIPGALNLWNQGEYHWVYFSFDVPADYEQTEEFLKKEYEDCQRECRQIKNLLDAEKRHQEEYTKFKKGKNPKFDKRQGRIYNGKLHTGGTPPVGSRKKNKRRRITKKKK